MTDQGAPQSDVEIRPDADLVPLRFVVDARVDDFVRRMVYQHRVSCSAVVETALLLLMVQGDDAVGEALRRAKAGLRRR